VKTIVMEHLNGMLFHKFGTTNKNHTNQSINGVRSAENKYLVSQK
jgi:hypothetical protein